MYKLNTMYVQNKNILKQEKQCLNNYFNKFKNSTCFTLLFHFVFNLEIYYFILNFLK